MAEHEFALLRQRLESTVTPPPFTTIRRRRRRRTQRLGAICAALASLVLLTGAAVTWQNTQRYRSAPGTNPPTSVSAWADVEALVATRSGTVYAVSHRCTGPCPQAHPGNLWSVLRSPDLGATWTLVGDVPGTDAAFGARLFTGDDGAHLWLVNGSRVLVSADGGRTWEPRHLAASPQFSESLAPVAVAGDTLWGVLNGRGVRATASGPFAATSSQLIDVRYLAAASTTEAYALASDGAWYTTTDAGNAWTRLASPCAGTPVADSAYGSMAIGPDGTWWFVCADKPADLVQRKWLAVSADRGHTWFRYPLETAGWADRVYPVSGTVAWRAGGPGNIYRTTDRAGWQDVTRLGDSAAPTAFAAIDADTALYYRYVPGARTARGFVTRDGGRTWIEYPFG
jgi:photosystem II stability/assembly factor-like uncharacterized protein